MSLIRLFFKKALQIIPGLPQRVRRSNTKEFTALRKLVDEYNGPQPAEILFLGDSVLERTSRDDSDARTLGQMLRIGMHDDARALCISGSGYHSGLFREFLRVFSRTSQSPQMVVLEINLRSFSPQWHHNPAWQYVDEMELVRRYVSGEALNSYNVIHVQQGDVSDFEQRVVGGPESQYKTVGDFRRVIKSRPQEPDDVLARWRAIFEFHYMHPLDRENQRLMELREGIVDAVSAGIYTLLFITPINWMAGEQLHGRRFTEVIASQISIVEAMINETVREFDVSSVRLKDFSRAFGRDRFFHPFEPTEHLNAIGRTELAALLIQEVHTILPRASQVEH